MSDFTRLFRAVQAGEAGVAEKLCEEGLREDPNNGTLWETKAAVLLEQDKFEAAAQQLEDAASGDEQLARLLRFYRAYALYRLQRLEEALRVLDEAPDSRDVRLRTLRAQTYYQLGRYGDAADAYLALAQEKATGGDDEEEEGMTELLSNLATSLLGAGRAQEIIDHPSFQPDRIEEAYELLFARATAEAACGHLQYALDATRAAEELCERVLRAEGAPDAECESELLPLRAQRAALELRLLRPTEAQRDVQALLRAKPKDPALQSVLWSVLAAASSGAPSAADRLPPFDLLKRSRGALSHEQAHKLTAGQRAALRCNECLALALARRSEEALQAADALAADLPRAATPALVRAWCSAPPLPKEGASLRSWAAAALDSAEAGLRSFLDAHHADDDPSSPSTSTALSLLGVFGDWRCHAEVDAGAAIDGGVAAVALFLAHLLILAERWLEAARALSPAALPASIAFSGPVLHLRWVCAAAGQAGREEGGEMDVAAVVGRLSGEEAQRLVVEHDGDAASEHWHRLSDSATRTQALRSLWMARGAFLQRAGALNAAADCWVQWASLVDGQGARADPAERVEAHVTAATARVLSTRPDLSALVSALALSAEPAHHRHPSAEPDAEAVTRARDVAKSLVRPAAWASAARGTAPPSTRGATIESKSGEELDQLERSGLPEAWWAPAAAAPHAAPDLAPASAGAGGGEEVAASGGAGEQEAAAKAAKARRSKEAELRRRARRREKYLAQLREKKGLPADAKLVAPPADRWVPKSQRRLGRKKRRGPRYQAGGGAQGSGVAVPEGQQDRLDARAREEAGKAAPTAAPAPAAAGAGGAAAARSNKKGGRRPKR